MKHNHPLRVSLPIAYPIELHRNDSEKYPPDFPIWYVIALSSQIEDFSPPSLPLTILCDSAIQMVSWILVHPIMVDPKEHVVGS